jgi:hypothetical protein
VLEVLRVLTEYTTRYGRQAPFCCLFRVWELWAMSALMNQWWPSGR